MPQKNVILIIGLVLCGIASITFLTWRQRAKLASLLKVILPKRKPQNSSETQIVPEVAELKNNLPRTLSSISPQSTVTNRETKIPADSSSPPPDIFQLASLEQQVLFIPDADLSDCLQEILVRIKKEGQNFSEATSIGFIEEMVDRVDDLDAMKRNYGNPYLTVIESFRKLIIDVLSACDAEIIHCSTWDPAMQRAISKEPTPDITSPYILRYGSTGFRRHSELIRKQEVILAVPHSH